MPILLIIFSIFNTYNLFVMSLTMFFIGLIVGIVPALISTMISKEFPQNKGGALGLFNFTRYIGMSLGSITIGLFSAHTVPIYFTGIATLILLLFIINKMSYKRSESNIEQLSNY
ncbi:MAG TPA: hypothetical protein DCO67_06155 [Staphylococcus sp.]|uniref:MFS transporter n=1 Tax=Mammaliicoccus vitulinus TaxID=71237 RepID=UPI000ECFB460|nr:MFS transporter [Mammaliicoccus vitulinus]HAL09540.1 hypothetical protein [Staphylococcus sp.]